MQHGIMGMHTKFQALKVKIARSLRVELNYAKLGCIGSCGAHNFYFLAKGLKQHAKMPAWWLQPNTLDMAMRHSLVPVA